MPSPDPGRPEAGAEAAGGSAGPALPGQAAATGRGWRRTLSAFEIPQFRWLFVGNVGFFLGMQAQGIIVRPWLAYEITGSELALGTVTFAVAVPMTILTPFGGVLADRMDRRTLIALAQSVVVVNEIAGLTLLVSGLLQFWHLVVLACIGGSAFPFIMPARQAIVVNVVGRQRLSNAMALNMAGMNMTRIAAPPLAGFLIGPLGLAGTWAVSVGLFSLAVLSLARVHACPPPAGARLEPVTHKLLEGVRYLQSDRLVLMLLLFGLIPMFLTMPFQSLLVVFARSVWDAGTQGLGVLNAAAGIGGVAGSVYVASRRSDGSRLLLMVLGVFGFCGFLLLFSLSPSFLLALPLLFAANAFSSVYGVVNNTSIQLVIPDELRGRVSSFLMFSFTLPMLGALPLAAAAQAWGAPLAVAGTSLLAMGAALTFLLGSAALRSLDRRVGSALEHG